MSFTDKKLEIAIVGFAVVLTGGLGYLLKTPVQNVLNDQDIVYEMPRPKASFLASLFSLGDREISRDYKNPFKKKEEDKKKAEEAKKIAKAAEIKKAQDQKKKADKKKTDVAKKPKVDVEIVGEKPGSNSLSDEGSEHIAGGGGASADYTNSNSNKSADSDSGKMSGTQWRSLLAAQPTAENVAKLVAAYNNDEVDSQTFYTIVADLYRSNKSETQTLGLTAVKSVYSAQSFAVTAEYYDDLSSEVQQQAHSYLLTYATTSKLGFLKTALQSSSAEVVTAATEVVLTGYQSALSGSGGSSNPRSSRGDISSNAVSGYSQFIPVFQQLAQSQDSTIASLASSALNQMQSTVAAL